MAQPDGRELYLRLRGFKLTQGGKTPMFGRRTPPNWRPEHELILCGARKALDSERAARLRAFAQEKLDWFLLLGTAADQRIEPLLYQNLNRACPTDVPPIWLEFLQRRFEKNARRNLYVSGQLLRILDSFETNGIRGIPYKGPALGALAYGNLALRASGDLDIFVRQRDLATAREVLLAMGYSTDLAWMTGLDRPSERVPGQYLFTWDYGRVVVELHTERTLRYFPVPLNVDDLERRLEAVPLGGREIATFSPEDLLTILCVHGTKHFWDRLQWIVDIGELAELPRGLNWDLAIQQSEEMQSRRMVFLGLKLAHDLLGSNLPGEVLRQAQADRRLQLLAARVCEVLFRDREASPNAVQRLLFRIRTREKLHAGLRYGFRLATAPTEEDWEKVELPGWLSPLYAVVRPLRLLRKYGLGLRKPPAPDLAWFLPTPTSIAERMLELAEVKGDDVLYDLGCGNGQIVVAAAKRYGISCVGVDIDPQRIAEAKAKARREGVEHLVRFVQQDAKTADLTPATIVTLFLTELGNAKLRERLDEQLRPGTRVVSRDSEMPGWAVDKSESVEVPGAPGSTLYLWRMQSMAERSSNAPAHAASGEPLQRGRSRAAAGPAAR